MKSPGVPREAPVVAAARERGIPVHGELELAWRLLPNRFVAVTGTNGKTTTVELLGEVFRAAGTAVAVAGNVGTPLSSHVGSLDPRGRGGVRGVQLPARGRERLRPGAPRSCSTWRRTTSTATAPSRRYRDAKLRVFAHQDAGRRGRGSARGSPCPAPAGG